MSQESQKLTEACISSTGGQIDTCRKLHYGYWQM